MLHNLQSTLIPTFLAGLNNHFEKKKFSKELSRVPMITP